MGVIICFTLISARFGYFTRCFIISSL